MTSFSNITVCYFSPTGGTAQVACHLAEALGQRLHLDVVHRPYTLLAQREKPPVVDCRALLVWATPVYAGRIPNKTLGYVKSALQGKPNTAIALVAYGNRDYDHALAELLGLMKEGGCRPIAAAAVVTRHAMSTTLAAGRPDATDVEALNGFADRIAEKLRLAHPPLVTARGDEHPGRYYTPLRTDHAPANFLKVKPQCDLVRCTRCGACLAVCPMDSIRSVAERPVFDGICIKCHACVRKCTHHAKYFDDPAFLSHVAMLEANFQEPKKNEMFL